MVGFFVAVDEGLTRLDLHKFRNVGFPTRISVRWLTFLLDRCEP